MTCQAMADLTLFQMPHNYALHFWLHNIQKSVSCDTVHHDKITNFIHPGYHFYIQCCKTKILEQYGVTAFL